MEHIFFNMKTGLAATATKVFNAIGITNNILEEDSLNVLGGIYYEYPILGCRIKLEQNSYEWEDKYKYMITVKKDVLSDVTANEENVRLLLQIVIDLLHRNLTVEVAVEVGDELEVYRPKYHI